MKIQPIWAWPDCGITVHVLDGGHCASCGLVAENSNGDGTALLFDPTAAECCERTDDDLYDDGCAYQRRGLDCRNARLDRPGTCGCRAPDEPRLPRAAREVLWPAVRAFRAATRTLDAEACLAREADHATCPDGYGAADLEGCIDRAYYRVAIRVAFRFGLTGRQLQSMCDVAWHVEDDRLMQALQRGA